MQGLFVLWLNFDQNGLARSAYHYAEMHNAKVF
jgi:hypothetical protein